MSRLSTWLWIFSGLCSLASLAVCGLGLLPSFLLWRQAQSGIEVYDPAIGGDPTAGVAETIMIRSLTVAALPLLLGLALAVLAIVVRRRRSSSSSPSSA